MGLKDKMMKIIASLRETKEAAKPSASPESTGQAVSEQQDLDSKMSAGVREQSALTPSNAAQLVGQAANSRDSSTQTDSVVVAASGNAVIPQPGSVLQNPAAGPPRTAQQFPVNQHQTLSHSRFAVTGEEEQTRSDSASTQRDMAAASTQAGAAKKRPAESVDEDTLITDAPSVSKKRKPRYLPYEHILGRYHCRGLFRPGYLWWAQKEEGLSDEDVPGFVNAVGRVCETKGTCLHRPCSRAASKN